MEHDPAMKSNELLKHFHVLLDCAKFWDDNRVIPDSFSHFLHYILRIIREPRFLFQGSR